MSNVEHDFAGAWMAERYASGQMSEPEEQEFEALLLQRPDLVADVAAAHRLRAGFARLQQTQELDGLLRKRSPLPGYYALAASILIALVSSGAWLWHSKTSGGAGAAIATSLASLQLPPNVTSVAGPFILANTRSATQPTRIVTPSGSGAIALRMLPEMPSSSGRYHVTIDRPGKGGAEVPLGATDVLAGG